MYARIPSGDQQELPWLKEDTPQPGVIVRSTPPPSPSLRDDHKPSWLYNEETPVRTDKKNKKIGSTRKSMIPIVHSAKKAVPETEDGWCCPSDPVLYWCRILHAFSGLCLSIALLSNGYLLCLKVLNWRSILLHCYAVGFCIIILGVELNIAVLVKKLLILEFWIYRGLFYVFIGILTFDDASPVLLQDLAGLVVIFIGLLYILLGSCGIQSLEAERYSGKHRLYREIVDDFSSPDKV